MIETLRAQDVCEDVCAQVRPLTLSHGLMWSAFQRCRSGQYEGRVSIFRDVGVPVGWALRWRSKRESQWTVYVYVDWTHRRKGIGGILVDSLTKRVRKEPVKSVPWDDGSESFYSQIISKNPKVVKALNYGLPR